MFKALLYTLFVLSLAFLSGCAGVTSKPVLWQDETVDMVWPEPPDKPRIRYLRSLSGAEDFKENNRMSGPLTWLLGERQNDLSMLNPFAVSVSRSGSVWVADSGAHMLFRLDMGRRKVEFFQEFAGLALVAPAGVVVDDERQLVYLSDSGRKSIFVLDAEGNYLDSWGPGEGFKRPAGLALDRSGRLLVADAMAGVVYLFNLDGTVARKIQSKTSPDGKFKRPLSVAVGPQGQVLVLDAFAFQVEVQDAEGALLGTIGQLGDAPGYLARPRGLAVDQGGHVFVSDAAFDNIQVFDMTGDLLMFWGSTGREPGNFSLPAGLFVDHASRLFVADSYNYRVQAYQLLP